MSQQSKYGIPTSTCDMYVEKAVTNGVHTDKCVHSAFEAGV